MDATPSSRTLKMSTRSARRTQRQQAGPYTATSSNSASMANSVASSATNKNATLNARSRSFTEMLYNGVVSTVGMFSPRIARRFRASVGGTQTGSRKDEQSKSETEDAALEEKEEGMDVDLDREAASGRRHDSEKQTTTTKNAQGKPTPEHMRPDFFLSPIRPSNSSKGTAESQDNGTAVTQTRTTDIISEEEDLPLPTKDAVANGPLATSTPVPASKTRLQNNPIPIFFPSAVTQQPSTTESSHQHHPVQEETTHNHLSNTRHGSDPIRDQLRQLDKHSRQAYIADLCRQFDIAVPEAKSLFDLYEIASETDRAPTPQSGRSSALGDVTMRPASQLSHTSMSLTSSNGGTLHRPKIDRRKLVQGRYGKNKVNLAFRPTRPAYNARAGQRSFIKPVAQELVSTTSQGTKRQRMQDTSSIFGDTTATFIGTPEPMTTQPEVFAEPEPNILKRKERDHDQEMEETMQMPPPGPSATFSTPAKPTLMHAKPSPFAVSKTMTPQTTFTTTQVSTPLFPVSTVTNSGTPFLGFGKKPTGGLLVGLKQSSFGALLTESPEGKKTEDVHMEEEDEHMGVKKREPKEEKRRSLASQLIAESLSEVPALPKPTPKSDKTQKASMPISSVTTTTVPSCDADSEIDMIVDKPAQNRDARLRKQTIDEAERLIEEAKQKDIEERKARGKRLSSQLHQDVSISVSKTSASKRSFGLLEDDESMGDSEDEKETEAEKDTSFTEVKRNFVIPNAIFKKSRTEEKKDDVMESKDKSETKVQSTSMTTDKDKDISKPLFSFVPPKLPEQTPKKPELSFSFGPKPTVEEKKTQPVESASKAPAVTAEPKTDTGDKSDNLRKIYDEIKRNPSKHLDSTTFTSQPTKATVARSDLKSTYDTIAKSASHEGVEWKSKVISSWSESKSGTLFGSGAPGLISLGGQG